MNQQEILKKIGGIIAELKDQHSYLAAAENGFNDLELELFMANANFLTDHIVILQKINHQHIPVSLPAEKPVLQLDEVLPKPQIPDYFDEQELVSAEEEPFQFKNPSAKTIEPPLEEVVEPQETIFLSEVMPPAEPVKVLVEDASFTDQKSTSETHLPDASFIDQKSTSETDLPNEDFELEEAEAAYNAFRPETISLNTQQEATDFASDFKLNESSNTSSAEPAVLTLNDRIAAQKGLDQPKSKTENQTKNIQDLQSMISLNDKLLFVKELFNGYNLAYSEAINILNRYTNMEQAEHFLNLNYTVKNNWKDKPVTTEKFMDLLRKKLS